MSRFRVSLVAAALLSAAGPVSADLLITKAGASIETAGAWRVDGRRVLFNLPDGMLSSLRTDEVDLDASALATARAAEAAAAAAATETPPAPAAAILTLTEDDLAKDAGDEAAEVKPEGDAAPANPLQIVSWEQMPMPDDDGVQLFGVVKNTGKNLLTAVNVTAVLYGEEGGMLANGDAQLNRSALPAGETANFRIEFPGLPDFASVKFDAASRGFETRAEEGEEGTEGEFDEELGAGAEAETEEGVPAEAGAEGGDEAAAEAAAAAESEKAAIDAYNENMKATGSEPPPGQP